MKNKIQINFKKTNELALLPSKREDDTGWDVYSVENKIIPARGSAIIDVGLTLAYITPGYWIQVGTRSGMGFKHGLLCHPGVIDNEYRGNMGIKIYNLTDNDYEIKQGDRIAQLIVYKNYNTEINWGEIQHTNRGSSGFGSSGK